MSRLQITGWKKLYQANINDKKTEASCIEIRGDCRAKKITGSGKGNAWYWSTRWSQQPSMGVCPTTDLQTVLVKQNEGNWKEKQTHPQVEWETLTPLFKQISNQLGRKSAAKENLRTPPTSRRWSVIREPPQQWDTHSLLTPRAVYRDRPHPGSGNSPRSI